MSADDFEAIAPLTERCRYRGEEVEVTPLRVGQIPAVARALREMRMKALPTDDVLGLLADYGEQVIRVAALCMDRPEEWIAGGALDDLVLLLGKISEVNADFFQRRLLPALNESSGALMALLGQILSAPCNAPDTAGPTA